jgi:hypothetical protein
MAPPYCGFPSLSHQFPEMGLVDGVVELVGMTVADVACVVAVIFVVVAVVIVVEETVVALLQDAKTIDATMSRVITSQKVPLFILPSIKFISATIKSRGLSLNLVSG